MLHAVARIQPFEGDPAWPLFEAMHAVDFGAVDPTTRENLTPTMTLDETQRIAAEVHADLLNSIATYQAQADAIAAAYGLGTP